MSDSKPSKTSTLAVLISQAVRENDFLAFIVGLCMTLMVVGTFAIGYFTVTLTLKDMSHRREIQWRIANPETWLVAEELRSVEAAERRKAIEMLTTHAMQQMAETESSYTAQHIRIALDNSIDELEDGK